MEKIKHYKFKCPVCGNDDFIKIKEANDAVAWDVEGTLEVYGCTHCYYLLHFNETAVTQVVGIEEDRDRLFDEIENSKKELARLEEEGKNLESKLESLIEEHASEDEINKVRGLLENDIQQRIKILKWDIKRIEDGGEDDGYWPPYNRHYDRFSLCLHDISELYKRINELDEKLESIRNGLSTDVGIDQK